MRDNIEIMNWYNSELDLYNSLIEKRNAGDKSEELQGVIDYHFVVCKTLEWVLYPDELIKEKD